MFPESTGPNLTTPPDLDREKAPVRERGVSSVTAELPQHIGVDAEGMDGNAL